MGIIVSKDQEKSELSRRITADLRARSQAKAENSKLDFVEDSEYAKDFQKTGKFSWFWFILVALAIASLVFIIIL